MISVLGAGSWGTALTNLIANNGNRPSLWARRQEVVDNIIKFHHNKDYLPKSILSPSIQATTSLKEAIKDKKIIFLVIPAQKVHTICSQMKEIVKKEKFDFTPAFVICSKGIEKGTAKLISEIAILSGPNFAVEVADLLPTVTTVATKTKKLFNEIAEVLNSDFFNCHHSEDIITTELAGTMKNIVAIASGISVGLNLGENAKASIIVQGFNEIGRVCDAFGGNKNHLNQPAGIGDLILTCGSTKSRNMSLGLALGQGKKLKDIVKSGTFEGFETSKTLIELAKKLEVEVPLCKAVSDILSEEKTTREMEEIIRKIILM
jgi:glycerol-3-phosphate dehydrogenase (NAD(P)+)